MSDINVLLHEFGVNCGDHAETRVSAVTVSEHETVRDMVDLLLTRKAGRLIKSTPPDGETTTNWRTVREPDGSKWLTIRLEVDSDE